MTLNGTENNFYYLNRNGRWADFTLNGLEQRADGALQLATVPRLAAPLPWRPADAPPLVGGRAGLAVTDDGRLFYTQPTTHRLMRLEHDNETGTAVPCLSAPGTRPAQWQQPYGLVFDPARNGLYVADSGNGRVQLFDVNTWQLLGLWDGFENPVDVTVDATGALYVLDTGAGVVYKKDQRGYWRAGFAARQRESVTLARPVSLAAAGVAGSVQIYVLDAERRQALILAADGRFVTAFGQDHLDEPLGLAVTETAVYVGDNQQRRVVKFRRPSHEYVGAAFGYAGPVAALAVDGETLWLHPGGERQPLPLALNQAHVREGAAWGGPFVAPRQYPVTWHRLKALLDDLSEETAVQLFTLTDDALPAGPVTAAELETWQPLPLNVDDGLILGEPAVHLWVGVRLTGDGLRSPLLRQMQVTYDHDTYRQQLPAFYSRDAAETAFLDRFLSLFESVFADAETEIAGLGRYVDPQAIPADWLPWLADWLALPLDEQWSESLTRTAVAGALTHYHQRGTVVGLRQSLRLYAGVDAVIEEPIQQADWWGQADDGPATRLGFSTRLAAVYPGSAVLRRQRCLRSGPSHSAGGIWRALIRRSGASFSGAPVSRAGERTRPGRRARCPGS